jgi:hypothetical protein
MWGEQKNTALSGNRNCHLVLSQSLNNLGCLFIYWAKHLHNTSSFLQSHEWPLYYQLMLHSHKWPIYYQLTTEDIVGFEAFTAIKFNEALLYLNRMELPYGNNSSPEMT